MASFAVILPAAGKSTRFSSNKRKKPFVDLKGRPVWVRAAECFINRDDVRQVFLVVSSEDMEWVKEKFRPNLAFMNVDIVEGGSERFQSVQNALARVASDVEFVAVHDAARPLIVKEWVDAVFAAAESRGPPFPPSPRPARLTLGPDRTVRETVSREGLWLARTPQVFQRKLLLEAFAKRGIWLPPTKLSSSRTLGIPSRSSKAGR